MTIALFDPECCWRVATYGCTDLGTNAPVRADTLFEIGSITKTFTAIAVLQAAEAGLLDLRAPVTAYLPWFQVQSVYEPIRIYHLLNQSTGMIGIIDQSPDIHSAVWMLRDSELAWPPGEQFLYSDARYQVLALVLEAVTGRSFRLGEEPSPERVRFAQFIQGKAHCTILSGTPYYRFFTP